MKYQPFLLQAVTLAGFYPFAQAKISSFSPSGQGDIIYSVTVPESTASTGSGPVLFQIKAPTTLRWVGLGQGSHMVGANIFVLYSSASSRNVTISPRTGKGHFEPEYNPEARVSLLEGSGIENGIMTANVRCESCALSDSWIYAYKEGDPLNSNSVAAEITFHDGFGITSVDLKGAVSTSENPFLQQDTTPSSGDNNVAQVGDAGGSSNDMLIAHGLIMSIAFVLLIPSFALLTSLPVPGIVTKIHAPLQIFTLALAIAGMGLGIKLGKDGDELNDVHPILGLVVVSILILFQPAIGLLQHLHFRRTGGKGVFSYLHRWLGRVLMILGVINGGLGFRLAGIPGPQTPWSAVIAYCVIAGVMGLFYFIVQVFGAVQKGRGAETNQKKAQQKQDGSDPSHHAGHKPQNST